MKKKSKENRRQSWTQSSVGVVKIIGVWWDGKGNSCHVVDSKSKIFMWILGMSFCVRIIDIRNYNIMHENKNVVINLSQLSHFYFHLRLFFLCNIMTIHMRFESYNEQLGMFSHVLFCNLLYYSVFCPYFLVHVLKK